LAAVPLHALQHRLRDLDPACPIAMSEASQRYPTPWKKAVNETLRSSTSSNSNLIAQLDHPTSFNC
jgi:hypothetical protein